MISLVNWSWVFGLVGMFFAVLIYQWVAKQPPGTELMQKIEGYIFQGAMAFLKRQYSTLAIFVVIVFILLIIGINWQTAICFITGAACSMFAGFFGMRAATKGNSRTAWAANQSGIGKALIVSYFSGSVMGRPVCASQTRAVLSDETVSTCRPSGLNCAQRTSSSCCMGAIKG